MIVRKSWQDIAKEVLFDVVFAVVIAASTMIMSLTFTPAFWSALGLMVARTAIQAAVVSLAKGFRTLRPENGSETAEEPVVYNDYEQFEIQMKDQIDPLP